jgi:hypothetical protein
MRCAECHNTDFTVVHAGRGYEDHVIRCVQCLVLVVLEGEHCVPSARPTTFNCSRPIEVVQLSVKIEEPEAMVERVVRKCGGHWLN